MEYEKARSLLIELQRIQMQSAHQNGRWSPNKQKQIERGLKQLLAGLIGRAATDEEIEKAQIR
jgi:hypothetical protein